MRSGSLASRLGVGRGGRWLRRSGWRGGGLGSGGGRAELVDDMSGMAHHRIKVTTPDGRVGGILKADVVLIAAGFEHQVPKGYVYFAMAFAVVVELLNIRMRRRAARPVHLHEPYARREGPPDPP